MSGKLIPNMCRVFLKMDEPCPGWMAQLFECNPAHQKVAGSIWVGPHT